MTGIKRKVKKKEKKTDAIDIDFFHIPGDLSTFLSLFSNTLQEDIKILINVKG